MMYGPQAALIAESFTGRLRYSGASLGYQLASVIAGGPAPLIAAWLFAQYRSTYAIAAYILLCAILSLISTAMLKDYTNRRDRSQQSPRGSSERGWCAQELPVVNVARGSIAPGRVGPVSFSARRLLTGVREAGFYPGVMFYLSTWFPVEVRARVFAWFNVANPMSSVISGPVSAPS
jgi:MFS family permease